MTDLPLPRVEDKPDRLDREASRFFEGVLIWASVSIAFYIFLYAILVGN
jgi:hypothetical protein